MEQGEHPQPASALLHFLVLLQENNVVTAATVQFCSLMPAYLASVRSQC